MDSSNDVSEWYQFISHASQQSPPDSRLCHILQRNIWSCCLKAASRNIPVLHAQSCRFKCPPPSALTANTLLWIRSSSPFHAPRQQQGNWSTRLQRPHPTLLCSVSATRMFFITGKPVFLTSLLQNASAAQEEVQAPRHSILGPSGTDSRPPFQSYLSRLGLMCLLAQTHWLFSSSHT